MVVLDVFSGAGGLAEGFFRKGCTFASHVEADANACATLKTRISYWKLLANDNISLYNDYLKKNISRDELWTASGVINSDDVINETISNDTYQNIKTRIEKNMQEKDLSTIDIIIGGPPCQAYSIAGRGTLKEKVYEDPRNSLYKYYVKFLNDFQPKVFVFENVPGIRTAANGKYFNDLKKAISKAGYEMDDKELISSDFGVLQNRKRVILIGWKKELKLQYPNFEKLKLDSTISVNDILKDLPKSEPDTSGKKISITIEGEGMYTDKTNPYLEFAKIREPNFDILTQHIIRPTNNNDREIYKRAIDLWEKEKKQLLYKDLPKKLQKQKNITTHQNRFTVVKGDQQFAHTVLAHISVDGHYYIHPDKTQKRSISLREAARIQSFPDNFYFEGSRSACFKQIGNAVPPFMAEQIAEKIKEMIYE
jgi:DNA (cytosine-5)-methyltransferase 1